jgi:cation diffusion facilitator family transporter
MSAQPGIGHIVQSLAVNLIIAVGKGVAAWLTGSGAMFAETLHSFADCGNQILLLVGVRRARQPATDSHPLGYGTELYFWSFLVALLLFSGGGLFSIYEGMHAWSEPEPVGRVSVGLGMLGFAFALEGWSTVGNVREINRRRGTVGFLQYLRDTKDSDLIVVFGENAAAVIGLVFAAVALGVSAWTGDGRWDALGSVAIGMVLVGVALFLAVEIKSLLVGERADPELHHAINRAVAADPRMRSVYRILTIQRGPGEVLVALKVHLDDGLGTAEIVKVINEFEARLRADRPDCRWLFVEPDVAPPASPPTP